MSRLIRRVADYTKLKWSIYRYNYGWSDYVFLFDGWVAKCAMAVPIVGYLILFNDSISQHLSFDQLAGENLLRFGLSSTERLKLIYFGLILLGTANICYRVRRPFTFKIGTNQFEYAEDALKHFTPSAYIDIHGVIRHEGHHSLHGKYYDSEYEAFLDLAFGKVTGRLQRDDAAADWTGAKRRYEGLLRSMLLENFLRNNIKRRISLSVCLVLSLMGYLLLFIPSADLFFKVVAASFHW